MRRTAKGFLGIASLAAAFLIPAAALAATPAAEEVVGVVRPVAVLRPGHERTRALGFVDAQGEVLVLRPVRADRAAFREARRLDRKAVWVHLVGVKGRFDGVTTLRVEKISEE